MTKLASAKYLSLQSDAAVAAKSAQLEAFGAKTHVKMRYVISDKYGLERHDV